MLCLMDSVNAQCGSERQTQLVLLCTTSTAVTPNRSWITSPFGNLGLIASVILAVLQFALPRSSSESSDHRHEAEKDAHTSTLHNVTPGRIHPPQIPIDCPRRKKYERGQSLKVDKSGHRMYA